MYKQIKPLGSSGKIQVTPEQSGVVQKALFEMGYGSVFVFEDNKDHVYIFWMPTSIAYSNSIKVFKESWEPLHLFTDYFEPI